MLTFFLRGESRKCLFFLLNLEGHQMQELVGEPGVGGGVDPTVTCLPECH